MFLLFAEGAHAAGGGHDFYNTYLNYPGFEAWKFINLLIFAGLLTYILRKPLSEAFKARRENIRRELINAQAEREKAQARLNEAQAKSSSLADEVAQIKRQADADANAEVSRITEQTEADERKIRETAQRELTAATASAKQELRKYSAEESIKRAEQIIKQNLQDSDAERLVEHSIAGLGGAR